MFYAILSWLANNWQLLILDLAIGTLIFFVPFLLLRRFGPRPGRRTKFLRRPRIIGRRWIRKHARRLSFTGLNITDLLRWRPSREQMLWVWVPLVAAAWVIGIYFLIGIVPWVWIPIQLMMVFYTFIFIFPPIPGAVNSLVQQPNRFRPTPAEIGKTEDSDITTRDYPPSRFGFFVKLVQGREIRIELGGIAVKGMMDTDHRMYLGEQDNNLTHKQTEYWENVPTPPGYKDSHPIPVPWKKRTWLWLVYSPFSIFWWIWKRYVYRLTGTVFTGFYPFQMPRVVPMERFVMRVKNGNAVVDRIEDYSNHYRIEQFVFPLLIGDMDTKDMIPLKVLINVVASVFNSYLTAYRTDDRWSSRLIASITDPVTAYARATSLRTLWVADSEAVARTLAERVLALGRRQLPPVPLDQMDPRSPCVYGIQIHSVEIIDISPMNPADTQAFGEQARAEVKKLAMYELAQGNASELAETAKAMAAMDAAITNNPAALEIARLQARIRTAQAAADGKGNNLVILDGGNTDPNQALLLQALRRFGNNGGPGNDERG